MFVFFYQIFVTAWISSNGGYPSVVCSFPLETVLHRLHWAHSNWQTLRPSSDAYRSRLDRRSTQRHTSTVAPSKGNCYWLNTWFSCLQSDRCCNGWLFLFIYLDISRDCQRTASQMMAKFLLFCSTTSGIQIHPLWKLFSSCILLPLPRRTRFNNPPIPRLVVFFFQALPSLVCYFKMKSSKRPVMCYGTSLFSPAYRPQCRLLKIRKTWLAAHC